MQIIGYRRCRTLSQLVFESSIQILLQIWILAQPVVNVQAFENNKDVFNGDELIIGVIVSLIAATCHSMVEILMLYIESKAAKMALPEYFIICLSGRLEWVPFSEKLKYFHEDRGKVYKNSFLFASRETHDDDESSGSDVNTPDPHSANVPLKPYSANTTPYQAANINIKTIKTVKKKIKNPKN